MMFGSPAWKPVAILAELISGMISASTPSPMVHGPKPSPMSEFRSMLRFFTFGAPGSSAWVCSTAHPQCRLHEPYGAAARQNSSIFRCPCICFFDGTPAALLVAAIARPGIFARIRYSDVQYHYFGGH